MKKLICLTAVTAAMLALSACGESGTAEESSAVSTDTTTSTEMTVTEDTAASVADTTAADTTASADTATEAVTKATTAAASAESAADTTTAATSADTGWKAAYQEIITQYKSNSETALDAKWDLLDLDQDGTPELLLSEGDYHAGSVLYYYYENGAAKQVMDKDGEPLRFGAYGSVFACPEEHLLGFIDMHMGCTFVTMDKYENHKITELMRIDENSDAIGVEEPTYNVNGEVSTEAAYNEKLAEYNSKNWIIAGSEYSLDDLSMLE